MKKPSFQEVSFLLTSGLGISFLVFLNAAQPFVLRQVVKLPNDELSKVSSTLIFSDELLALVTVLLWGRMADKVNPSLTTALANIIVAISLMLFVNVKNAYPGLLLARLLFSIGASGITTMLSATLNLLTFTQFLESSAEDLDNSSDFGLISENSEQDEGQRQPLLGWRRQPRLSTASNERQLNRRPAALPALLGISAGLGALLAVFVYLRIPTWLSHVSKSPSSLVSSYGQSEEEEDIHGLKIAFYIVAGTAILNSVIAFIGLPSDTRQMHIQGRGTETLLGYIRYEVGQILKGFEFARSNPTFRLACAGGFAARAQTISVSAFLPLYVASYYFKRGACDPSSKDDLKQSCHEAYALASAISGVTQVVALLSGVIFVWVVKLCRTLGVTSSIGCISFAILGRSALGSIFGGENPNNWLTWLATIGIGLAQTGSVTLSLAMITKNREQLHTGKKWWGEGVPDEDRSFSSESTGGEDGADEEMSGALAGVYSFCGGLGVLSVSALARILSNKASPAAPFLGIAGVDLLLAISAFILARRFA